MDHTLVLLGRFPGKDRAVAVALARDFGRDDAWGIQVVGAAPIVLLDSMSAEQAQAVHAALADVEAAGSRIEIQPALDKQLAKLSWPAPPRIKGRLVSEFGSATTVQGSSATLILPCPYTGQKMKVTITVSVSRADGIQVSAAATALPPPTATGSGLSPRPVTLPMPLPATQPNATAYRPIPTPVVTPAVGAQRPQSTPAAGMPRPQPVPVPAPRKVTPAAVPQQQEPVIMGLDSLDELTPLEPEPAAPRKLTPAAVSVPAPRTIPAPVPRPMPTSRAVPAPAPRPQGGSAPLPDVPILHNPAPAPAAPVQLNEMSNNNAAPMPVDLLSAPMDLSAFEAGVSASGIMRAVPAPAAAPAAPADASGSGVDAMPGDDGSLCSVSIGKSGNSKVHEVVAEMQGISVADAARLCQKPIVTLAKDITVGEARGIKQQLARVNVVAKITRRT